MKAMIFAAGLGTRLRPLTDHTPKALVSVAGKPMLERVILRLKEAGFNDITVNIHHLLENKLSSFSAPITISASLSTSVTNGICCSTQAADKESASVSGRQRTVPGAQCRHPFRHQSCRALPASSGKQCRGYTARQSTTDITLPAAGRCQPPARLDKQIHR